MGPGHRQQPRGRHRSRWSRSTLAMSAWLPAAPEVASVLTNPKVALVTDDGRRWLRHESRARRFDAIVANTTFHFRANATNLLSADFLSMLKRRISTRAASCSTTRPTPSRVQRTGCASFAHGARFTNHMVLSSTRRSTGTSRAGDARCSPTASTAGRCSILSPPRARCRPGHG